MLILGKPFLFKIFLLGREYEFLSSGRRLDGMDKADRSCLQMRSEKAEGQVTVVSDGGMTFE